MPDERYILSMSPEQAALVENACELFARLKIGQFNRITEMMLDISLPMDEYCRRRDDANDALRLAACLLFKRGVYNQPETVKDIDHHRAWNVYQVLRYVRSWHDNPSGGPTVNYNKPRSFIDDPLPTCRITTQEEIQIKYGDYGRWINVNDYRPGRTGSYIVCTASGAVCSARYVAGNGDEPGRWNGANAKNVRFWMPFPERP